MKFMLFFSSELDLFRDTVSSIGADSGTGKLQIEKKDCDHLEACYFRHALALDECRLKFVPEYISGKQSILDYAGNGAAGPRIKEVWFAGCHSDMYDVNLFDQG